MEELVEPYIEKRADFGLYKSNVCHKLKEVGDIEFIISTIEGGDIRKYYRKKWYPESLYLLAMLDYVSRENNVPICSDYDDIRSTRLSETLYPLGVILMSKVCDDLSVKEQAFDDAIPEFRRFNIVECEVRNVI